MFYGHWHVITKFLAFPTDPSVDGDVRYPATNFLASLVLAPLLLPRRCWCPSVDLQVGRCLCQVAFDYLLGLILGHRNLVTVDP